MNTVSEWGVLAGGILGVFALGVFILKRQKKEVPTNNNKKNERDEKTSSGQDIVFQCQRSTALKIAMYQLALGEINFQQPLTSNQVALIKNIAKELPRSVKNEKYFPRRPQLLPQLLRIMRDDKSSVKDLTNVLSQDPVLTGNVIKMANSSYYRSGVKAVDSIERAVVLLGEQGLRSLMSATIMHPVFYVPEGAFKDFSRFYWSQAVLAAEASKHYAESTGSYDSFSAHFFSLLTSISYTVLLRLAADFQRSHSNAELSPLFLVKVFESHSLEVSKFIATDWKLGEDVLLALQQTRKKTSVNKMGSLARTLYYGRLVGTAALLCSQGARDEQESLELLKDKGLSESMIKTLWAQAIKQAKESELT